MNSWGLPGFSFRDLVANLINHIAVGAERRLVVCSPYLPYGSEDPPPSTELEEFVRYCENENLYLIVRCNSNAHQIVWGSNNCNGRGDSLYEFLNTTNLEILNQGEEHNFCNVTRQEVIDITLGSYGLLETSTGWEMFQEPSLSNHRYILKDFLQLCKRST